MADTHCSPPLLALPPELRIFVYRELYSNLDRSKSLHIYTYRSRSADKKRASSLNTTFGLIHTSKQLRREALPELLEALQLTLHPAPASSLNIFTAYYSEWVPSIRRLCIADADVFLENRANQSFNPLQVLLVSVSRRSGGSLRELSISLPRSDWNNLAGCSSGVVLSLWLFREVLQLRGLERFVVCKPPDRIDRPRWGRKPSWDVVARHMSESKWMVVEALIDSIVTRPVEDADAGDMQAQEWSRSH